MDTLINKVIKQLLDNEIDFTLNHGTHYIIITLDKRMQYDIEKLYIYPSQIIIQNFKLGMNRFASFEELQQYTPFNGTHN